jgi:hypothetical protein
VQCTVCAWQHCADSTLCAIAAVSRMMYMVRCAFCVCKVARLSVHSYLDTDSAGKLSAPSKCSCIHSDGTAMGYDEDDTYNIQRSILSLFFKRGQSASLPGTTMLQDLAPLQGSACRPLSWVTLNSMTCQWAFSTKQVYESLLQRPWLTSNSNSQAVIHPCCDHRQSQANQGWEVRQYSRSVQ